MAQLYSLYRWFVRTIITLPCMLPHLSPLLLVLFSVSIISFHLMTFLLFVGLFVYFLGIHYEKEWAEDKEIMNQTMPLSDDLDAMTTAGSAHTELWIVYRKMLAHILAAAVRCFIVLCVFCCFIWLSENTSLTDILIYVIYFSNNWQSS